MDTLKDDFQYYVETIGNTKILRYRVPGWELLSNNQKRLLWCLYNAALYGRDIIYDQLFKYGLYIRRVLELILRTNLYVDPPSELTENSEWQLFVEYIQLIWISNGIHNNTSKEKILPKFTQKYFIQLMHSIKLPSPPPDCNLLDIIFNPNTYSMRIVENSAEESSVNFTANLTSSEIIQHHKNLDMIDIENSAINSSYEPEEHGLNSQLIKHSDGSIIERKWMVGGMYGSALAKCVEWIEKAMTYAENIAQKKSLGALIKYYRTGSLKDFNEYCKLWVQNTNSTIDMIHGFTEVYNDPFNHRGSFESIVTVLNPEASVRIKVLQQHAQWFEDNAPILPQHKRTIAKGIDARVVNVIVESGDAAPVTPIGVCLPNAEWFRTKYGSKSINLDNIVYSYDRVAEIFNITKEFYLPQTYERLSLLNDKAMAIMVDMHEVLGHGSGQIEPGIGDVATAIGSIFSIIEEARADLFACYYIMDPIVVKLGLLPDLEAGKALYDIEITNGLILQLCKVGLPVNGYIRDKSGNVINKIKLAQTHMRDRQLLASWVFEHGSKNGYIERIKYNNKSYFQINNYEQCRKLFGELLCEIQRIKSQGDRKSAEALVDKYGTWIDPDLHEEAVKRFKQFNMAPFTAFIQPELTENNNLIEISYPTNFMNQMLHYADAYTTLPDFN